MSNTQLTDEEKLRLSNAKTNAQIWSPNVEGEKKTQRTFSKDKEGKQTTIEDTPDRTTTTSQQLIVDDQTREGGEEGYNDVMASYGFVKDENGEYVDKTPTIGNLIPLRKSVEERAKLNRARAINAGVLDTLTTISDIITAGAGGNVTKRDKNTIAKDAADDTQKRRDALLIEEQKALAEDKKRFAEATKAAQIVRDNHNKTYGITQGTTVQEGGRITRTTETEPTTRTQTINTTSSPEKRRTVKMALYNTAGTPTDYYVDEVAATDYLSEVALYLNQAALDSSSPFHRALVQNNLWDVTENKPKARAIETIIQNNSYYQYLPQELQDKNRKLYEQSYEYNAYILSDEFKGLSDRQKIEELDRRRNALYGSTAPRIETATNGSTDPRRGTATQYLDMWYRGVGMPTGSVREAYERGDFGLFL